MPALIVSAALLVVALALGALAALSALRRARSALAQIEDASRAQRRRLGVIATLASVTDVLTLGERTLQFLVRELRVRHGRLHVRPLGDDVIDGVASAGTTRRARPSSAEIAAAFEAARSTPSTSASGEVLHKATLRGDSVIALWELELDPAATVDDARAIDELLDALAPAVAQVLSSAYAHRLSTMVRTQTAVVADVRNELDNVIETIADGIAVTDCTGEIVRLNAAGKRILGLDAAQALTQPLAATHPLVHALREGVDASGLEVAFEGAQGVRLVQVKLSALTAEPKSRAAVAVFRDVTRERQLEHELRKQGRVLTRHVEELESRKNALEHATRLKSEFLANMSHELRTPLNAVIGFTEVLLDGTYGTLNDKQSDCARDVLSGGRHLLGLINDILDLSKIEAGKMQLVREDLDLAEVVAQALTFVRPQITAKRIELVTLAKPGAHWTNGDPDRLRQVLVNLLSNAVKFTPAKGRVEVRVSASKAGTVRTEVIDTGVGIAPGDADKLFRDFSQVDGSITRRFGGTGLGLAISKRLIEMHGGTIGFTSRLGEGSCFFVELQPSQQRRATFSVSRALRRSSCSRLEAVAVAPGAPRAEPVLVLESDVAAARLLCGALAEAGIDAVHVASIDEARSAAVRQSFAAFVVHPEVDDASVFGFADMAFGAAVVATSTLPERDVLPSGAQVSFIRQPIDRPSFVDAVRGAMARRRGRRSALIVDSHDGDAEAVNALLRREGFVVDRARSIAEARLTLAGPTPDLVVLEPDLTDGDGTVLLPVLPTTTATVILSGRDVDQDELTRWLRHARIVLRKGTLSRAAFGRHILGALRALGPRRMRILVVDDNEQNLRLVEAVLAKRGYEIVEARDAESALSIARAERPDAILMDVMLPDIDGLTATRRLKGDPLTRAIPVIAVTANAMAGDEAKSKDAGCVDYVSKPIDSARLIAAIDTALRGAPSAA